MEDIARILSPSSASWVTWVLLFLLSIVVLNRSVLLSISTVWHSLLSYSDRMYTTGRAQSVLNTLLSVVFRWGVMGLSIYVLCYESGDFMALTYVKLLGGVGAMLLVQWLMSKLVGYTFLAPVQRESISEQRTIIYNAACVILLFCALLFYSFFKLLLCLWSLMPAGVQWLQLKKRVCLLKRSKKEQSVL